MSVCEALASEDRDRTGAAAVRRSSSRLDRYLDQHTEKHPLADEPARRYIFPQA
jgi:hypothetical protein